MSLITQYFPSGGIKSNAIPDVASGTKNSLISQYYPTVTKAPVEAVKESSFFEKIKEKLGGFVSSLSKKSDTSTLNQPMAPLTGFDLGTNESGSAKLSEFGQKRYSEEGQSEIFKKNLAEVEAVKRPVMQGYQEPGIFGSIVEAVKMSTVDAVGSLGATSEMIGKMTGNMLLTEAGQKINTKAQKVLASNPEWGEDPNAKWDAKKVSRIVAGAAPSLLATVAATMVAGPIGAMASGFSLEAGSTYKEAKEMGASEGQAQLYGSTVGVVNSYLEKIFPSKLIKGVEKNAIKKVSQSLTKDVLSKMADFGVRAGKNGLLEGSTESVQQLWSNVIATNYDKNRGLWDGILESFVGGFGSGGIATVAEKNNIKVVENEVNLSQKENVVKRQSISVKDQYKGAKTALASIKPDGTGSIAIILDEKAQGKGLGTKIVSDLEGKLAERGITTVELKSFPESIGFWQKKGYTVSGEESMNLVPMTKTLEKTDISNKKEVEHGDGIKLYRGATEENMLRDKGRGIAFATEKDVADRFSKRDIVGFNYSGGKVGEYVLPKSAKILDASTLTADQINGSLDRENIIQYAKDNGYDAVDLSKQMDPILTKAGYLPEKEIRVLNTAILKPSSTAGNTMLTSDLSELTGSLKGRSEKPGGVERAMAEIKDGKSPAVRIRKVDGKTVIEDGGHRVEAYKRLGIKDVPVQDVTSEYEPKGAILPTKTNEDRLKLVKDEKSVRSTLKDIRKELLALKTEAEGMAIVAQEQRSGINTEDVAKLKRAIANSKTLQEGDIETIRKSKSGKLLDTVLQNVQEVHPEMDEDQAFDFARELPTKADENARTPTIIELEKKEKSLAKLLTQLKEKQKELSIKDSEALTTEWDKALAAQEELINVIKIPSAQMPVGEGKVKVSRLEARTKDVLGEMSQEEIDRLGLTTYNQMNKKENITLASKYVAENTEQALRVIKGEIDPPAGMLKNSIYVALKALGAENTDIALKIASLGSTRMGQEISILSEIDKDSPVSMMEDVVKTRIEAFERKTGRKSSAKIKNEVSKIDAEMKAPSGRQWDSFLKDILC